MDRGYQAHARSHGDNEFVWLDRIAAGGGGGGDSSVGVDAAHDSSPKADPAIVRAGCAIRSSRPHLAEPVRPGAASA